MFVSESVLALWFISVVEAIFTIKLGLLDELFVNKSIFAIYNKAKIMSYLLCKIELNSFYTLR